MRIISKKEYNTINRIKELMDQESEIRSNHGGDKLTQKRFAEELGIAESTVSNWFKGTPIRKSNLQLIADYFKCDINFLTCKQDYPHKNKSVKIKPDTQFIRLENNIQHIESLMSSTTKNFSYQLNFESTETEEVRGSFVENNIKYIYVDNCPKHDQSTTEHRIIKSQDKEIEITKKDLQAFVRDIQKYIDFKLQDLFNRE